MQGSEGIRVLVSGLGFMVQGLGLRVHGSWFMVQGSGFRVQGLGCRVCLDGAVLDRVGALQRRRHLRVYGSGFNVWVLELRV